MHAFAAFAEKVVAALVALPLWLILRPEFLFPSGGLVILNKELIPVEASPLIAFLVRFRVAVAVNCLTFGHLSWSSSSCL